MASITLNHHDAMRILNNPDANPDARVIAAMTVALFETSRYAPGIDKSTRSIVLKVAHMVAEQIYAEDE